MKSSAVATSSDCASEGGIAPALRTGRDFVQAREHGGDVRLRQALRAFRERRGLLGKGLEGGTVARRVLEPGVLLLRGRFAQLAQDLREALVVSASRAIGNEEELVETVSAFRAPMRSDTFRARPTQRSRSRKTRSATRYEPSMSCFTCWSSFAKSGFTPA
jgi:hypothetical protein